MLYLIRDCRGNETLVKIGSCKNIEQRMKTYKSHNPKANLIQFTTCPTEVTEGNSWLRDEKAIENICHQYFKQNNFKKVKGTNEWFAVPKGQKNYRFQDIQEWAGPVSIFGDIISCKKIKN